MNVEHSDAEGKYKLVPPEGGWGYVICVSCVMISTILVGSMSCFGVIFNDFLIETNMGSAWVTALNAFGGISSAVSSYATNALVKKISFRKVAFIGAISHNIGSFGLIFMKTKLLFFICQGFFQSVGFGLLYNLSCTILNDFFVKKRLFIISLTQLATALLCLSGPKVFTWALDQLGFRGALILSSAMSMHLFVAVSLMQPVSRHLVKEYIVSEKKEESKELLAEKGTEQGSKVIPVIKLTDTELKPDTDVETQSIPKTIYPDTKKRLADSLKDYIDVPLLKSYLRSNASFGLAFGGFADFTFYLMLPQYLYSLRWDDSKVAGALMLVSAGDLATRVMSIILHRWLNKLSGAEIYIIGLVLAFISRLCFLCTEKELLMLIVLTVMGMSRCPITTLPPLIIAETVGQEKFTAAMGIFMMLFGPVNLIFGPAIGAIRDLTDSYETAFFILTSFFAIVAIFWVIELCYKRNKHKHQSRPQKNKQNKSIKK